MSSISRLALIIKEDVNREESSIINFYSNLLNVWYKLVIWFGIPFLLYLLITWLLEELRPLSCFTQCSYHHYWQYASVF